MIICDFELRRNARKEERNNIPVLSRAVRRHNVHNTNTETHALLLFQFDRTLCTDLEYGLTRFHPAARFRGEAHFR